MSTKAEQLALLQKKLSMTKTKTGKAVLEKKIDKLKSEMGSSTKAKKDVTEAKKKVSQMSIAELKKKPEFSFLKGMNKGKIEDDQKRVAKPKGWRFKGKGKYRKPTKAEIVAGKKRGNVYYEARNRRSDVSRIVRLKDGGFVGKGEMVWNKISASKKSEFLYENFTPEITPRSQEILVGKAWNFLPKNVKIKFESKYADVENYANGGGVGLPKLTHEEFIKLAKEKGFKNKDEASNSLGYRYNGEYWVDNRNVPYKKLKYATGGGVDVKYKVGDWIASGVTNMRGTKDLDFKRPLIISKIENGRIYFKHTDGTNAYNESVKFFERIFKKYDKPKGYAKGGKLSKYKYVPNRDINEMEINKRGKSVDVDGADILDGVYIKKGKYATGGDLFTGEPHRNETMMAGGQTKKYYKHKITVTDKFDNVYDVALFRSKGDALISLNALDQAKTQNLFYELKEN